MTLIGLCHGGRLADIPKQVEDEPGDIGERTALYSYPKSTSQVQSTGQSTSKVASG